MSNLTKVAGLFERLCTDLHMHICDTIGYYKMLLNGIAGQDKASYPSRAERSERNTLPYEHTWLRKLGSSKYTNVFFSSGRLFFSFDVVM